MNFAADEDYKVDAYMKLNGKPEVIGYLDVPKIFGCYLLYLPVYMDGRYTVRLPDGLECFDEIVNKCMEHQEEIRHFKYVYLSYECSWVEAGKTQKRPGWHADGFLTEDVNYIWYSSQPTIFNKGEFIVTPDHEKSIEEFEKQAIEDFNYKLPCRSLIRMDQTVVHKAAPAKESGVRTFVKVSFSDAQYNLKGNTHNPMFNYSWKMFDRATVRNHPALKEVDSVPEGGDYGIW